MTLSLMIKKKYLAEKVAEQQDTGVFHERRAYTKFWRARIGSVHAWGPDGRAVFLCGHDVFPAVVRRITIKPTPAGIEDAVTSKSCYNIECEFISLGFVKAFTE
jgi:hypothetical protein